MNVREYCDEIQRGINRSPFVTSFVLNFEQIDEFECYIKATVTFSDSSEFRIAEYVKTEPSVELLKYRYQYMDANGKQIARWDDAPHHKGLDNFPYQKHNAPDNPSDSEKMDFQMVVAEISLRI